ncbi:MAG: hypothetical protein JXA54_12425 [Candidatus Heimdallarchaeota archaeon]|nr:hypothetical protein [Candidatus Heimdallarchaeota archaeon]
MLLKLTSKSNISIMSLLIAILMLTTLKVAGYAPLVDTTPPSIVDIGHYPMDPSNTDLVLFNCSVSDISGIQSVTLYYRANDGSWINVPMLKVGTTTIYEYT